MGEPLASVQGGQGRASSRCRRLSHEDKFVLLTTCFHVRLLFPSSPHTLLYRLSYVCMSSDPPVPLTAPPLISCVVSIPTIYSSSLSSKFYHRPSFLSHTPPLLNIPLLLTHVLVLLDGPIFTHPSSLTTRNVSRMRVICPSVAICSKQVSLFF